MKSQLLNLLIPSALAYTFINLPATAQTPKSVKKTIVVANGDTTINGKRLAEMDKKERERYQKEFTEKERNLIEEEIDALIRSGKKGDILIHTFKNGSAPMDVRLLNLDSGRVSPDSITWSFRQRLPNGDVLAMNPENARLQHLSGSKDRFLIFDHPESRMKLANSQAFHFSNADKQGIVTEVNLIVSDADKNEIKEITKLENSELSLAINDLALFPNFSTGKTSISFNLTTKGTTTILVTDSDNNTVFTDVVKGFSGTYLKQINMVKNGTYYASVSQNGKWFVKKVVKM